MVSTGCRERPPAGAVSFGLALFEGKGVAADPMVGYMWSNLAVVQLSGEERGAAEKQRDYIASKLAPDQLSKAQQMARDWKPLPASTASPGQR
jgi:hypothetical protein